MSEFGEPAPIVTIPRDKPITHHRVIQRAESLAKRKEAPSSTVYTDFLYALSEGAAAADKLFLPFSRRVFAVPRRAEYWLAWTALDPDQRRIFDLVLRETPIFPLFHLRASSERTLYVRAWTILLAAYDAVEDG